MKKQGTIEGMEKRDAAGYARIPSQASKFEEWESEQVWPEDEEGEPEAAINRPSITSGGKTAMEDALERAAEIRHKLGGRNHSDSTQLVREDRQQESPRRNPVDVFSD